MKKYSNYTASALLISILLTFTIQLQAVSVETSDMTTVDNVIIYSVSTSMDTLNYQRYGSLQGGTLLYIKAVGLDQTASNNDVKIGTYPCIVPESGLNQDYLLCETTAATDIFQRQNLPVVIQSGTKAASTCGAGAQCTFSYLESYTPVHNLIIPRSTFSESVVSWQGIWRVANTLDIKPMLIDNFICQRLTLDESKVASSSDSESIDGSATLTIKCQIPPELEGGYYYPIKMKTAFGQAIQQNSLNSLLVSSANADSPQYYHFRLVPTISALSSNIGSLFGQRVIIYGSGFNTQQDKIRVQLSNGQECSVQSVELQKIYCVVLPDSGQLSNNADQLPPQINQNTYVSGSGMTVIKYNLKSSGISSSTQLRQNIWGNAALMESKITFQGKMAELEQALSISDPNPIGQFLYSYFKPQTDGDYRFYLSADDQLEVWISKTPGSFDQSASKAEKESLMQKLAVSCSPTTQRNYFNYACTTHISDFVTLQSGSYYYLEVFHISLSGQSHFTISLEAPLPNAPNQNATKNRVYEVQQIVEDFRPDLETFSFAVWDFTASFYLSMQYRNPVTKKIEWNKVTTVKYTWSQYTKELMTSTIDFLSGGFGASVQVYNLDNKGKRITSGSTTVAGREWVISYTNERPATQQYPLTVYNNGIPAAKYQIKNIQARSPPVKGTYRLRLGDYIISYFDSSTQKFISDIPYNADSGFLAQAIKDSLGLRDVQAWHTGNPSFGYTINLQFDFGDQLFKDTDSIPLITADVTNLDPQNPNERPPNLPPRITASKVFAGSRNLFYQPIPNEMLFQASDAPQVLVSVVSTVSGVEQNILASCTGFCSYVTTEEYTPTIESATLNSPDKQLLIDFLYSTADEGFNNQNSFPLWLLETGDLAPTPEEIQEYVQIEFAGAACSSVDINAFPNVTCNLTELNPDGTLRLEAGSYLPTIYVEERGYADTTIVAPIEINITFSSINITQSTSKGGVEALIIGTGFPLSLQRAMENGFTINFGDAKVVQIMACSNTQVAFMVPAAQGIDFTVEENRVNITLKYAGKTSLIHENSTFLYNDTLAPLISSISPSSASPVLKGDVYINGSNFGQDLNKLRVFLVKNSKITFNTSGSTPVPIYPAAPAGVDAPLDFDYELSIVSFNKTFIHAVLGGGHVGNFTLAVWKRGAGLSPNITFFQYIIKLFSVVPRSGSLKGGTILTITGDHFSNRLTENQVFIGNAINVMCNILTANQTVLTCQTPPIPKQYYYGNDSDGSGKIQKILIFGRLIEESTCLASDPSDCQFTWNETLTPTLDTPLLMFNTSIPTFTTQQVVDLTGSLFTDDANVVIYNQAGTIMSTCVAGILSDNKLTFTVPSLPAGRYEAQVKIGNKGTAGTFSFFVNMTVTSLTPLSGPLGGADIIIAGNGFSDSSIKPVVTLVGLATDNQCLITEWSNTLIKCRLPSTTLSKAYKLQVSCNNQIAQSSFEFTYNSTSSQNLQISARTSSDNVTTPNTFWVSLTVQTLAQLTANQPTGAYLEFQQSKASLSPLRYQSSSQQIQGSSISFEFRQVPSGKYKIFVQIQPVDGRYGYSFFNNATSQIIQILQPSFTLSEGSGVASPLYSFAGGQILKLTGNGFVPSSLSTSSNKVEVCGFDCPVTGASNSELNCSLPSPVTPAVQKKYYSNSYSESEITQYKQFGDKGGNNAAQLGKIVDNARLTAYTTKEKECFIGFDFGEFTQVLLSRVVYTPGFNIKLSNFYGTQFQISNDSNQWTTLFTITSQDFLSSQNTLKLTETTSQNQLARYFRFYFNSTEDQLKTMSSFCEWSSIKLFGFKYFSTSSSSDVDFTNPSSSLTCPVTVSVNGYSSMDPPSQIKFSAQSTATISSVTPNYGSLLGGTQVTITGQGFGTDKTLVNVLLEQVACEVTAVTDTTIICTSGSKLQQLTTVSTSSFLVTISEKPAILLVSDLRFQYGLFWNEHATWGGEVPPRKGDSVFVPKGQVLIVNESTEHLYTVVVEGTMLFLDEKDMTFDAEFLIVRGGHLIIGSESRTYQHKLTVTLHGNYFGPQLPEFGNKVLACRHCILDIHGQQKTPSWTDLKTSAKQGDDVIKVNVPLNSMNWSVGDEIVIASSDYEPTHAERRIILSITAGNGVASTGFSIVQLDRALDYDHYSELEEYTQQQTGQKFVIPMQTEVGILTRNVVIQGDSASQSSKYGAHILISGNAAQGTAARIENVEFRNVGQQRILGRYPIHFLRTGDSSNSYVRGCAIHNSLARVIALQDVQFLRIQSNVGYNTFGHSIYFVSGSEVFNTVEENLIVQTRSLYTMLQSDITPASFFITNPSNVLRNNRAAGSNYTGFWYFTNKKVGDGRGGSMIYTPPRTDICPSHSPLSGFTGNRAHSNMRYGLRIKHISTLTAPCGGERNPNAIDQFAHNPVLPSQWSDFVAFKNEYVGVLAEELGLNTFQRFYIADSSFANIQIHLTNFSSYDTVLRDSLLVGRSAGQLVQTVKGQAGLITPRTDGFYVQNVTFINFNEGTTLLKSCSGCEFQKLWIQGGKVTVFSQISYLNISSKAQKIYWQPYRREIYIDTDGSLTALGVRTSLTPAYPHFEGIQECRFSLNLQSNDIDVFNNSVLCTGVELRRVYFSSPAPIGSFQGRDIRVYNLFNKTTDIKYAAKSQFSRIFNMPIYNAMGDYSNAFAVVFATNYSYNIHWREGVDFSHIAVESAPHWTESDLPIVLKFNYSATRELFDVKRLVAGKIIDLYPKIKNSNEIITQENRPNVNCTNGDNWHDIDGQNLYVCINGKGKQASNDLVDITAVYCRFTCPKPVYVPPVTNPGGGGGTGTGGGQPTNTSPFVCVPESYVRYWSSDQQWLQYKLRKRPNEKDYSTGIPQTGDDVLIPCQWTIRLDVTDLDLNILTVDGNLIFEDQLDDPQNITFNLRVRNIFLRGGTVLAGSKEVPFPSKINIILFGGKEKDYIAIDDFIEPTNKGIQITGRFEIYGQRLPFPSQVRLYTYAKKGDVQLELDLNYTLLNGWQAGDYIVVGTSSFSAAQSEKKKIVAIQQVASSGNVRLLLDSPLSYDHYGDQGPTASSLNNSINQIDETVFGGSLDMRAAVGILSRDIKIIGTDEPEDESWGATIMVYYWLKPEDGIDFNGRLILDGVELNNVGQRDSSHAGINLLYISGSEEDGDQSVISNSAIYNSKNILINAEQSSFFNLINNVFYSGAQNHIRLIDCLHYSIQKNLLVDVHQISEESSYYYERITSIAINKVLDDDLELGVVAVNGNIVQGSTDYGFIFPFIPCNLKAYNPFFDNEAGACGVGLMWFETQESSSQECLYAGDNSVYHSQIGAIIAASTHQLRIDNLRVAETHGGVQLRMFTEGRRNSLFLSNSWFSGLARPNCLPCYARQESCSNIIGLKMLVATRGGYIQEITSITSFDASAFLTNVVFHNFRNGNLTADGTEVSSDSQGSSYCMNNSIFTTFPSASDATAGHYLTNVVCQNCTEDSLVRFDSPDPTWKSHYGGCGEMDCSGLQNLLIVDTDGSFFTDNTSLKGTAFSAISNNSLVNKYLNCQEKPSWNALLCQRGDIAVVEFENDGFDKQESVNYPVLLRNKDDTFNNSVNAWREREYNGPEPLGERLNRFVSLIAFNQTYNISYEALYPYESFYQLQSRFPIVGEPQNWVIFKIQYPVPLFIEVSVNGTVVEPFSPDKKINLETVAASACGANNYFYKNRTIHFTLNGKSDCSIQLRLLNWVQINMHLAMTIEDFLDNDKQTEFIDRIATFLDISTDKLKIVGVRQSTRRRFRMLADPSLELEMALQGEPVQPQQNSSSNTTGNNNTNQTNQTIPAQQLNLEAMANKLQQALTSNSLDVGAPVTQVQTQVHYVQPTSAQGQKKQYEIKQFVATEPDEDSSQLFQTMALTVAIIILIAVLIWLFIWKKIKVLDGQMLELESQMSGVNRYEKISNQGSNEYTFNVKEGTNEQGRPCSRQQEMVTNEKLVIENIN